MLEFLFAALLIGDLHQYNQGISFRLTGISTKNEVIYYKVEAENDSPFIYDVEEIRCEIEDRKVVRRHAIQVVPMEKLSLKGDSLRIPPGKMAAWTIALRKEVLPPGQYLSIDLLERNGSRNLYLRIGPRELLRARLLN